MILKAGTYRFNDEISFSNLPYVEDEVAYLSQATINIQVNTDVVGNGIIFADGEGVDGTVIAYQFENVEFVYHNEWLYDFAKTVEILEDTEVNDIFAQNFISNTNYNEINAPSYLAEITYNGQVIASLNAGETATLSCEGKKMVSDVVVKVGEVEVGGSGIIEVEELPTENIDTEALYLCNGEYYKYNEGDGKTFVFNDVLTLDTSINCSFSFEFEGYANSKNGTLIRYNSYGPSVPFLQYKTDYYPTGQTGNYQYVVVYAFNTGYNGTQGWLREEYKTIVINEMPTDEAFLAWFYANARAYAGWRKLIVPNGTLHIQEEGHYVVSNYNSVSVEVTNGYTTIEENGTFDVTPYKNAIVDVPTIIRVDTLPQSMDERNIFVKEELYDDTTIKGRWVFNDVISKPTFSYFSTYFATEKYIGDHSQWDAFVCDGDRNYLSYHSTSGIGNFIVYNFATNEWEYDDSNGKEIMITRVEPTDETFVAWLKENATKRGDVFYRSTKGGWQRYSLDMGNH